MPGFDAVRLSCSALSNGIHASISVRHALQDISKSIVIFTGLCAALCCLTSPNPACYTWCAHPEQVSLHHQPCTPPSPSSHHSLISSSLVCPHLPLRCNCSSAATPSRTQGLNARPYPPLLLCANLRLQTYDLVVVLNHSRAAASEIEHLQRGIHLLSRRQHWRTGSVSATPDSLCYTRPTRSRLLRILAPRLDCLPDWWLHQEEGNLFCYTSGH
ncbi:hypothetical protein ACFX13_009247 [Malus domestica]